MGLQIFHSNRCHRVVVYKEDKETNIVKVFDSAYTSLDQLDVLPTIQNIFCCPDTTH